MTTTVKFECQTRSDKTKSRALRREGFIPAVLYGHKGAESMSLVAKAKDVEMLLKKASINNTLVDVDVSDQSWRGKALIREVQTHPWRPDIYHVSFFAVAGQDSVEVVVPVSLNGEAQGVREEGGVMEQIITELTIQCPPDKIPEVIDIDVTDMPVGTTLHIGDLKLPEGVTASDDPERTVLTIGEAQAEEPPEEEETTAEEEEIEGGVVEELGDVSV
ncbi:50S ribosomal protein L25/general stress protein Ctc [Euhalothece natronophila Z-M001]|uniref:Large ribosomal subunit protein bL25 n=1 Tax=Euhalothece natronophila Z-M001 TaxID=522448 RepID=A0A5B8NLN0_9CHRO|nr:50S ribosomal protein L25/general stress protein Ctc [Euhalothece natronophila]QDZ39926.1 50S ribosomal protein L25/general stress protein Ctc [Euhalothece natronophila Z-M001]